jgi:Phage gp6-like head-tail connector protein
MALITLEAAKGHLRITTEESNSEVWRKTEQASAIVLARCNTTARVRTLSADWTVETVPEPVRTAILVLLTHLYENAGNDMTAQSDVYLALDQFITTAYKDPVVA